MSKLDKVILVRPGFSEPTYLYEVKLVLVEILNGATMGDVAERLDEMGVTRVIIDNSYPNVIDYIKAKFYVNQILRRKLKESKNVEGN